MSSYSPGATLLRSAPSRIKTSAPRRPPVRRVLLIAEAVDTQVGSISNEIRPTSHESFDGVAPTYTCDSSNIAGFCADYRS